MNFNTKIDSVYLSLMKMCGIFTIIGACSVGFSMLFWNVEPLKYLGVAVFSFFFSGFIFLFSHGTQDCICYFQKNF